jgi:hypothetical protein
MAFLTKKDFAALCGIATNVLSTYIRRGKVVCKNDLIDTTHEFNVRFLEKQAGKEKGKADKQNAPKVNQETPPAKSSPAPEVNDGEVPPLIVSERLLKFLDTQKREKEIEKLQIDIDKKKGIVVPSELIKPVFLQHNQFIVTEIKNFGDEFMRRIVKKYGLNVNEEAEMKGDLVTHLNNAIKKATQASIKAVTNIINEHSQKKSIGEHE